MSTNESNVDRIVRGLIAVVALIAGIAAGGGFGIVLYVVAAIMAVTAAVGFCPIYKLVGINTCKTK